GGGRGGGGRRRSRRVARRWRRKRVLKRVDATIGTAAGIVVDISYGGAQLQMRKPMRPWALPSDHVMFAPDLRLRARRVWARAARADGPGWYGLEVDAPGPAMQAAWQAFVDRVS